MAELKRKEELTGADLARKRITPETPVDTEADATEAGPVLVKAGMSDEKGQAAPRMATRTAIAAPLFSESDISDLRGRWSSVQADFVDEPRRAVEEADTLVADLMKRLMDGFAGERSKLEKQWDRGDNVSTEDLRVALQRYRSFFDRLLKA